MINPSFSNPDLLPGDQVVSEALLSEIYKHFGSSAKLVVTRASNESIPRPLRAEDVPGSKLPAIHQPMVVGVMAGAESQNLVAVAFPAEEALAGFMAANPGLKEALVTRWRRYYVVWLQPDFLGPSLELPEVLWLSGGVVPISWLDTQDDGIKVYQPGTPKQVDYAALVWPEGVESVIRFHLVVSAYGPPFVRGKRKISLRLAFWASWGIDRLGLIYDPRIASFARVVGPSKKLEILSTDQVVELVLGFLQRSAALEPKRFPVEEINMRRAGQLMGLMRTMAAVARVSEPQGLRDFLLSTVRKQAGSTVTVEELWSRYALFCQARANITPYTRCEFQRVSPGRVREMYGKTRVNSIMRDGKAKRGYNDIALIAPLTKKEARETNASSHPGVDQCTQSGLASGTEIAEVNQVRDARDARDGSNDHSKTWGWNRPCPQSDGIGYRCPGNLVTSRTNECEQWFDEIKRGARSAGEWIPSLHADKRP